MKLGNSLIHVAYKEALGLLQSVIRAILPSRPSPTPEKQAKRDGRILFWALSIILVLVLAAVIMGASYIRGLVQERLGQTSTTSQADPIVINVTPTPADFGTKWPWFAKPSYSESSTEWVLEAVRTDNGADFQIYHGGQKVGDVISYTNGDEVQQSDGSIVVFQSDDSGWRFDPK